MGRTSDARDRLLESAGELIPQRGYNAVGIAELCSRAGVNKGSFYYFFPSKQSLAIALIDSIWHATRNFFDQAMGGDGPPLSRLARYFDSMVERHRQSRDETGCLTGCPFGNLALEMSTQDDELRERLGRIFDYQIHFFADLLAQAGERGDLVPGVEPRSAAESLVALIEGHVMLAKLHNDLQPLIDLAPAAFRLIGVRQHPEENHDS